MTRRITTGDLLLALVAAAAVLVARVALRIAPAWVVRRIALPRQPLTPGGRRSRGAGAGARAARAIGRAARLLPGGASCLEQATALRLMLGPLDAGVRVVIGVARPSTGLRAHAWVESAGEVLLGGACAESGYRPLRSRCARSPAAAAGDITPFRTET